MLKKRAGRKQERPTAGGGATRLEKQTSERKREHQPAEHDRRHDEAGEEHAAEPQLLRRVVPGDEREDEGDEEREENEQEKVAVHVYLRPSAMS